MDLETKLIAILALIIGLAGGGLYLHHSGYEEGVAEYKLKIDDANDKAKLELDAANTKVAQNQSALDALQSKIISTSRESDNVQKNYDTLRAQYANATLRLSVRTHSENHQTKSGSSATASSGTDQDRSIDLLPETATSVLDAGRGLKEDVRLKNECIDLYNAVRDNLNEATL